MTINASPGRVYWATRAPAATTRTGTRGELHVRALFSCLDASATQAGTVILSSCSSGTNQQWTLPGDRTIRSGGRCLTAPAALGNAVTVATCNNSAAQRWTV